MPDPTSTSSPRLPLFGPQRAPDEGPAPSRRTTLSPETERALAGAPGAAPPSTGAEPTPERTSAPAAPVPNRRRVATRSRRSSGTLAWTMARCLLLGAFIALAFAVWLAAKPVQNPGVQDCGAPLAFVVSNRTDVKVLPNSGPNAGVLIQQPTCRETVDSQLLKAVVAFGAFLGLGLVGAVIGLADDRWQYHKAPKFETLLRERPADAPGRLRAPPVVEEEELGVALPPIEGLDVVLPVFLLGVTIAGLLAIAGPGDVFDAIGSVGTVGLVALGLAAAVTFLVAGLQLVLAEPDPSEDFGLAQATELSLAASPAQRLLPGLGPLGLDAHALSVAGEPKEVTLRRLDARQTFGLVVHAVLLVVALLVAGVTSRPTVSLPGAWPVLVGVAALLALIGLARGPGRLRRLVVPPSYQAAREAISASSTRAAEMAGAALGLTILNVVTFVLALVLVSSADGGLPVGATLIRLALVYLVAAAVGALSPTPAGIGANESVAVLGLLLCGVPAAPAVAGVLLFRAATVWLPIVIGLVPFGRLRRRGVI